MKLTQALCLSPDPQTLAVVSFVGAGGKSTAMFRLAAELAARGQRVITTTTTRIAADQIKHPTPHHPHHRVGRGEPAHTDHGF